MSANNERDRRVPRRSPTLFTSLAIVGVAGVFAGVTVIGQRYAAEIDGMARSLATDAAPGIERLSTARGQLRRLTFETRDALRAADVGSAPDRKSIEMARKSLDVAIADYLAVPPYPGEHDAQRGAISDIDDYRRQLDVLLDCIDHRELKRAHSVVATRFMPASDRADRAIERLERLDADYASRTGSAIKRTRRKASRMTYALAALAAFAALLVTGLAWRMNRSFAAAADARADAESMRKRLAERRANELEIFAARVAHDLRNPLSSIALRVALVQRDAADPMKVRACVSKLLNALHHATQIIDGLLDFARAGGTPDPDARVDVCEATRTVIDDLAPELESAGIVLSTEMPPILEVGCSAGPLLSVVGNLLRNAVKFMTDAATDRRAIAVRILDAGSCVHVEIEDTGPGVPPGTTDKIFEPYIRGASTGQPGVGLGLATVKRIVEAHRGRVGVRAAAIHGSCFWFELPKPPTTPPSPSPPHYLHS
jgi:signal transduction histidine kinase